MADNRNFPIGGIGGVTDEDLDEYERHCLKVQVLTYRLQIACVDGLTSWVSSAAY